MRFEWDADKEAINLRQHGLSLATVERFDWAAAQYGRARTVGGEERWQVFAMVDGHLLAAVYTLRGLTFRIISVRRASRRERRRYAR